MGISMSMIRHIYETQGIRGIINTKDTDVYKMIIKSPNITNGIIQDMITERDKRIITTDTLEMVSPFYREWLVSKLIIDTGLPRTLYIDKNSNPIARVLDNLFTDSFTGFEFELLLTDELPDVISIMKPNEFQRDKITRDIVSEILNYIANSEYIFDNMNKQVYDTLVRHHMTLLSLDLLKPEVHKGFQYVEGMLDKYTAQQLTDDKILNEEFNNAVENVRYYIFTK